MAQYADLTRDDDRQGSSIFDPAASPVLPYATSEDLAAQMRENAAAGDRAVGNERAGIGNVKDKVFDAVHDMFGGQVTRALPEEYANETVELERRPRRRRRVDAPRRARAGLRRSAAAGRRAGAVQRDQDPLLRRGGAAGVDHPRQGRPPR